MCCETGAFLSVGALRVKPGERGAPLMGTLKDMYKEISDFSLHRGPFGEPVGVRLPVTLRNRKRALCKRSASLYGNLEGGLLHW